MPRQETKGKVEGTGEFDSRAGGMTVQARTECKWLKKSAGLTGQFLSPDIDYTNVKLLPEQKFNFLVIYQVFIASFLWIF